jgi:chromosome segregation ATPase
MDTINDKVAGADEDANERALLLAKKKPKVAPAKATSAPKAAPAAEVTTPRPAAAPAKVQVAAAHDAAPAFLQTSAHNHAKSFLERAKKSVSTQDDTRGKVTHMLQAEGKRLKSAVLTSLAQRAQNDPFVKIKKLIQQLIERLLTEAKEEATQKGFCDEELGKARHERDERHNQIYKLMANIGTQKAHQEFLEDEIEELQAEVKKLTADLDEATKLREEEHDENTETIDTAKEGLEAITDALKVLKDFYKKAAKGKSLLEVNVTASPIDEDAPELAFGGKNTGNQDRAGGVIGMVEVIQSDFERTIKMTTQEEAEAQADFIQFERTSKSDIKGKETKIKLDKQDLKATKTSLKKNREDLKTETGLLDDCLKGIEELKPVCIDTGMSYTERVEKREEEIEALKKALCMLDGEQVEPECK